MIALEDTHADILKKAMIGQKIPVDMLAEKSGVPSTSIRALLDEAVDLDVLEKIAPELGLSARALCAIADQSWHPQVNSPEGLIQVSTPFRGGSVNAYIAHDREGRALIFDTGTEAGPLIEAVKVAGLSPQAIFITHAHTDHIIAVDDLLDVFSVDVYAVSQDRLPNARLIDYSEQFAFGDISLSIRETVGHAADGASFVLNGLAEPLVITGDALFAGSMGGGMVSYRQALETTRANLMSLEDTRIICPGHGPLSTIVQERIYNAFFGK